MKTILNFNFTILLLIASICSNAQSQMEIVIVGSSHDNAKSTQNFQAIIDKLKNFKPDMVFGEYLPATDYATLNDDHWAKKAFTKSRNYLTTLNPGEVKNLSSKIDKDKKALASFAFYHRTRMNLAINYAKNWDRGNADYQIFVLENYMKPKFGKEELASYNKMFGSVDSLKKTGLFKAGSEYQKLFFPLIYQMKQDRIYNMDCQTFDKPWGIAWAKMDSAYKVMLKKANSDSTSDEAATVRAIDKYWAFSDEDSKAFNADPYAGMNSDKYGKVDEAWNLYGGRHFYGYAGFPTKTLKEMVGQWYLRNEGMCKNIIDQAKAKNAKRIVVGVGASHRVFMEEILARYKDIKIINYNDLK